MSFPVGVTLRPATADDRGFLRELYASTREQELDQVDWPPGARELFLDQQFTAQSEQYASVYSGASFDVIEENGAAIGRLIVNRGTSDVRIVDIAITREARGRGIGAALVHQILAESHAEGKRVSIHVEKFNPAMRLYQRLGFQPIEDRGVYLLMACEPR